MTSFFPCGRYVNITKPLEIEQEQEVFVLLPEGYKKEQEKFAFVGYISSGPKVDFSNFVNYEINLEKCVLVVEKRMIEKIEIGKEVEKYVILDQYIVGIVFSENLFPR